MPLTSDNGNLIDTAALAAMKPGSYFINVSRGGLVDIDAVVAAAPDCAVYCAMGDVRPKEAMADVRRLLEAGINVVGSAPGVLQYPWGVMPERSIERTEAAARQGAASVFITGVDPGFVTDLLPLALAGTCQSVKQIRTMEIADYATYDGATVMFDVMGFGNELGDLPMLYQPGVLSLAWGTAMRELAAGLGVPHTTSTVKE